MNYRLGRNCGRFLWISRPSANIILLSAAMAQLMAFVGLCLK
jgi:hypothetical protein